MSLQTWRGQMRPRPSSLGLRQQLFFCTLHCQKLYSATQFTTYFIFSLKHFLLRALIPLTWGSSLAHYWRAAHSILRTIQSSKMAIYLFFVSHTICFERSTIKYVLFYCCRTSRPCWWRKRTILTSTSSPTMRTTTRSASAVSGSSRGRGGQDWISEDQNCHQTCL